MLGQDSRSRSGVGTAGFITADNGTMTASGSLEAPTESVGMTCA